MRSKILWISLLLTITLNLSGQTVKVVDLQNRPVENVIVIGDGFSSYTNELGILQFFPSDGTSSLTFIHPNYKRVQLNWNELVKQQFLIVLEQRIREIEEVTIRPNKRAQLSINSPQKVVAITPANSEIFQAQTTADLLNNSGEVFIQKSQMGGGSPMIRGFSANRIMLVVDGVRMNNAIYRSGNLQNVISLDASSLEQTEVILGPGSVIYGSDALGGVIHFYTLKPRLSTSEMKTPVNATVRTSSANFEKTGHLNFNLAGKKWASATSITFSDFDDLKMGSWRNDEYLRNDFVSIANLEDKMQVNSKPNVQIQSGYSQFNAIQKIRYRPSELADFEYAFHYSTSSDIPRYDRLVEYSKENLKYAQWYYGPQKWMMHTFKGELSLKNKLVNNLTILAAIQDYTESRHDRKFQKQDLFSRIENVDIYSLNIDADKYFSKTQTLLYGAEMVYNRIGSSGFSTNNANQTTQEIGSRYPNNSNWWSLASYIMYNQLLSAETALQAGMRYNFSGMNGTFNNAFYSFPFDDFSDSNGALSVNFGLVFTPSDHTKINLNAATGFRAPNIDDAAKVFDSEPGNVIVPNPKLDPEYASSFETGFHHYLTDKLKIEFTAYFTRLYNAMVRRDGQLNEQDSILYDGQMSKVQMLTNASWANIGGLYAQFQYKINNEFKVKSGVNWQAGSDSDDLPIRHIAPLFGNFHAEWRKNKMLLDAYVLFNGQISAENLPVEERSKTAIYAIDSNGLPYSPAWWTLNVKGQYQVSETIHLNLGIENLLDMRYRPYSSGISAPGINFIFSVNLKL